MEFLYTIKSKRIIVESLVTTQTNIYFFGDVHRDTKSCDESRWQWFLKEAKHDKNAYFFGLGDYNDFASISEGKKLISAALHETTMEKFDQIAEVDNRKFAEETSFMQGHCLGLISGNHGWKFANGKTGDEDLAERLKTESLGYLCHYTLTFSERSETMDTGKNASVHFVLCHGKAGGKTAGITITQVDDLRRIFPIADIYCISADTEILTNEGWKNKDDIKLNDIVYSLNDNEKMEVSEIEQIIQYPYDGEMISIKNANTDQLLIPEHRVYYKHHSSKSYLINTADHISKIHSQIRLPLAGDIDFPEMDDYINVDMARLVGWILSEGHFKGKKGDHGSGILIYQKHQSKVNIILDLLTALDIKYSVRIRGDGVTVFYIKKESADFIKKYITNKDRLPLWVYYCNNKIFNAFFYAFILGDGCAISKTAGTFYSSSKLLMDDFQGALSLHGYRSNLKYKNGGFKLGGWVINYCRKNTTELNTKKIVKREKYNGTVWCITTKLGNFIARRNGKVFITGNCMGHDHQRGALPQSVLIPSLKKDGTYTIKQKRQFLCRSGAFKRAYVEDNSSYEVGRLLKPSDLGALKLTITFHRDKSNDRDVVITDIQAVI